MRSTPEAVAAAQAAVDVYSVVSQDVLRDEITAIATAASYRVRSFRSAEEFLAVAEILRPGCIVVAREDNPPSGRMLLERLHELGVEFPVVMLNRAEEQAEIAGLPETTTVPRLVEWLRLAEGRLARLREREFATVAASRLKKLTTREREILMRLIVGIPNKAIARELKISPRTVEFHRARIMQKIQAANLSQLVFVTLAAGLWSGAA